MKNLIIILFLIFTTIHAQEVKTDSLNKNEVQFEAEKEYSPNYYNVKNFDFLISDNDLGSLQLKINQNFEQSYSNNFLYLSTQIDPIELSLKNFYTNLNQIRNWNENKYDLGLVGNILKYTMGAAAVGLAGYHIYKYYIKKEE